MHSAKQSRRWVAIVVTLALTPTLTAAKCEPEGSGSDGRKFSCALNEGQPPKWAPSRSSGKGVVVASVKSACDRPPKSHSLTVWLEREGSDGKSWFQVGDSARSADIPPPGGRDYPVQVQCVDGQWRVRAQAEGLGPDGKPFNFTLPAAESHISVVRCRLQ